MTTDFVGGESTAENCQILQTRVNRFKSRKEWVDKAELQGFSCDIKFTGIYVFHCLHFLCLLSSSLELFVSYIIFVSIAALEVCIACDGIFRFFFTLKSCVACIYCAADFIESLGFNRRKYLYKFNNGADSIKIYKNEDLGSRLAF